MDIINLSQEERNRFIAWLDQEVRINDSIIEGTLEINLPKTLTEKRRAEIMACAIVSKILKRIL